MYALVCTHAKSYASKMRTLANSEGPDEMPHDVAFHQGLHCLTRQNDLQRKKYIFWKL